MIESQIQALDLIQSLEAGNWTDDEEMIAVLRDLVDDIERLNRPRKIAESDRR